MLRYNKGKVDKGLVGKDPKCQEERRGLRTCKSENESQSIEQRIQDHIGETSINQVLEGWNREGLILRL